MRPPGAPWVLTAPDGLLDGGHGQPADVVDLASTRSSPPTEAVTTASPSKRDIRRERGPGQPVVGGLGLVHPTLSGGRWWRPRRRSCSCRGRRRRAGDPSPVSIQPEALTAITYGHQVALALDRTAESPPGRAASRPRSRSAPVQSADPAERHRPWRAGDAGNQPSSGPGRTGRRHRQVVGQRPTTIRHRPADVSKPAPCSSQNSAAPSAAVPGRTPEPRRQDDRVDPGRQALGASRAVSRVSPGRPAPHRRRRCPRGKARPVQPDAGDGIGPVAAQTPGTSVITRRSLLGWRPGGRAGPIRSPSHGRSHRARRLQAVHHPGQRPRPRRRHHHGPCVPKTVVDASSTRSRCRSSPRSSASRARRPHHHHQRLGDPPRRGECQPWSTCCSSAPPSASAWSCPRNALRDRRARGAEPASPTNEGADGGAAGADRRGSSASVGHDPPVGRPLSRWCRPSAPGRRCRQRSRGSRSLPRRSPHSLAVTASSPWRPRRHDLVTHRRVVRSRPSAGPW